MTCWLCYFRQLFHTTILTTIPAKWITRKTIGCSLATCIAPNFARSLAITKWKILARFSGLWATTPWPSHKLSDTTGSNKAAYQWKATLDPVGPQKGKITSSLTKYGLWPCRTNVLLPENKQRRWDKHWFGTFHFHQRFGHAKCVHKFQPEAAKDGAEAPLSVSLAGDAGLRSQEPRIIKHRDHWWWCVGLQVQPRNKGAVVTVRTFNIPQAKIGQPSHSNVDHFLSLPLSGASQVRNTRPK